MSAISAAASRSAAIVSVLSEVETLRFLSHFVGSTPSAFSWSRPWFVEPSEPPMEDDVCLEMSIDFQPGPSSVGIWM